MATGFLPALPLAESGARVCCPQVTSQSDVLEEQKQLWVFFVWESAPRALCEQREGIAGGASTF